MLLVVPVERRLSMFSKVKNQLSLQFAKSGTVPDPAWESLNSGSELRYGVLNEEPLRMEFPESFKKRMNFQKEMWQLIEEYRCGNARQDRGRRDLHILNPFSKEL